MIKTSVKSLLLFLFLSISWWSQAQSVKIELGPDEVRLNQYFTITITVTDEKLSSYDAFPDLEGFVKRGTSSSSNMSYINNQMTSSQSITQSYQPIKEGTYTIPNFSLKVNGVSYGVQGKTVKVLPPGQAQQRNFSPFSDDVFDDFFGNRRPQQQEFIELEDDAFFALTTDKDEVFEGEGFTTTLAFYISDQNQAPINFHDPGRQLVEILKKIRPSNCWEENFNIQNIESERVEIQGKRYTKYSFYKATYFPFNDQDITFESVPLEMIKYKVAKNPSFFGSSRQEDFKTYYSKAKTVKVNPLPDHPLKDQVAVGNFKLAEQPKTAEATTDKGLKYDFNIYGVGNISAIPAPIITSKEGIQIYPPNTNERINRSNNQVTGSKNFSYFLEFSEPGSYEMKDQLQWIFFNTAIAQYDTLKPTARFEVSGESKANQNISSSLPGGLYERIEIADNTLRSKDYKYYFSILINVFMIIMLALIAYLLIKK